MNYPYTRRYVHLHRCTVTSTNDFFIKILPHRKVHWLSLLCDLVNRPCNYTPPIEIQSSLVSCIITRPHCSRLWFQFIHQFGKHAKIVGLKSLHFPRMGQYYMIVWFQSRRIPRPVDLAELHNNAFLNDSLHPKRSRGRRYAREWWVYSMELHSEITRVTWPSCPATRKFGSPGRQNEVRRESFQIARERAGGKTEWLLDTMNVEFE